MLQIHLQTAGGVPLYLQIVHQIKCLVASGRLCPGDEVPPIRALAEQLIINPNTVARAYLELERAGLVVKRHGAGTYVAQSPPGLSKSQRQKILADLADVLLIEAQHLGVPFVEVLNLLQSRRGKLSAQAK